MKKKAERKNGNLADRKKMVLTAVMIVLLATAAAFEEHIQQQSDAETVTRQEEGSGTDSRTLRFRLGDGEEQEVTVDVHSVERSAEETEALLEQAAEEWESSYLGDNASENEVRNNLCLEESYCDGLVDASYESSDYNVLDAEGNVMTDSLGEDGQPVEITATFSYGEITRTEKRALCILPPEKGSVQWLKRQLTLLIEEKESETRQDVQFSLPSEVEGQTITWEQEKQVPSWAIILLLGGAAMLALNGRKREEARKKKKEREEKLTLEYPQMVEQLSLLLGSGMTIRSAWERVLLTDQKMQKETGRPKRVFIEEMWITWREMNQGQSEKRAYEAFGMRIGLMTYRRLSSILSRNLSRGTRDVREQLTEEAREALELRKNHARQLGEEAGTKMLLPMMLMFVLILIVLLLPAASTF